MGEEKVDEMDENSIRKKLLDSSRFGGIHTVVHLEVDAHMTSLMRVSETQQLVLSVFLMVLTRMDDFLEKKKNDLITEKITN